MRRLLVGLVVIPLLEAGCGTAAHAAGSSHANPTLAAARAALAPTGKLRLGFPTAPPFLGQQDPSSGRWTGVAVTLGAALAATLGVPLEPVRYDNPPAAYQALMSGSVDVVMAPLQIKPAGVSGTPVLMRVQHSFLVKSGSPLQSVSDVDRSGITLGSGRGEGHTPVLAAQLHNAKLLQFSPDQAGVAALMAGQIDAYAGGRAELAGAMAQAPGLRILDGSFFTPGFGFATLASDTKGAAYLNSFAAAQLSSGDVVRDIDALNKPGVLPGPSD